MSQLPKTGVQLVAENYVQFMGQMNSANGAVRDFAQQAGAAINTVNRTAEQFDAGKLKKEMSGAREEVAKMPGPLNAMKSALAGFFGGLGGQIAGKLTQGLGAVTGFLTDAPQQAANFADKMNLYFAVADESAQGHRREIESLVLQLGKELPVSTLEAADAAIELAKGGLSPATLQAGALRDTLNFASAAQLGLAESATILIKQLGTFTQAGASADEQAAFMKTSMDLLTKAANASTVNVDELAHGMLQAGGTAKAVGVEYADFVATMGALSPAFSSSAEAGTSFKNFLLRLQPSTEKAYQEMSKLGVITLDSTKMLEYLSTVGLKPAGEDIGTLTSQIASYLKEAQGLKNADIEKFFQAELSTNAFYEANGELKSMAEIAGILQEATKGLTEQQRSMAFSTIFGNDAMNAAVQLSALGAEGMDNFAAQMGRANGVSEMFDATQKGANTASTNFQGTLEALQLSFGSNFVPLMELGYTKMNAIATVLLDMSEGFRGNTESLSKLNPVTRGIVEYLKEIGAAWNILKAGLSGNNISYALKTIPDSLASVVKWLIIARDWWNKNVVETGMLTKTFNFFVEQGNRLVEYLVSLAPLFQPLGDALWGFWEALVSLGGNVLPFLTDMFGEMMTNTGNTGEFIRGALQLIISAFTTAFEIVSTLLGYIGTVFRVTWSYIGDTVITASRIMMHTFQAAFKSIVAVVELALELVKAIITGDFSNMEEAYRTYSATVIEIWNEWGAKLTAIFSGIWDEIKRRVVLFVEAIPLMLLEFAYDLGVWVRDLKKTLTEGFNEAWEGAKQIFKDAWPKMKEALINFPDNMRKWISETWTKVTAAFNDLWTWDKVGKSMADGFIEGIRKRWKYVTDVIRGFAQQILNAFNAGLESKSPSRAFMRAGKSATDGFVIGLESQRNAVMNAVKDMSNTVVVNAMNGAREAQTVNNVYANRTNNYSYNLGVTTTARANDVIGSFAIMEALT